jgi:hypothetical protein
MLPEEKSTVLAGKLNGRVLAEDSVTCGISICRKLVVCRLEPYQRNLARANPT